MNCSSPHGEGWLCAPITLASLVKKEKRQKTSNGKLLSYFSSSHPPPSTAFTTLTPAPLPYFPSVAKLLPGNTSSSFLSITRSASVASRVWSSCPWHRTESYADSRVLRLLVVSCGVRRAITTTRNYHTEQPNSFFFFSFFTCISLQSVLLPLFVCAHKNLSFFSAIPLLFFKLTSTTQLILI